MKRKAKKPIPVLNKRQATGAISQLLDKNELGSSDMQRLESIQTLLLDDGKLNMAQVLAALFDHLEDDKAQAELRKFRGRIKQAAELSGMNRLELQGDSRKQTALAQRRLWWQGTPVTISQQSGLTRRLNPSNEQYPQQTYVDLSAIPEPVNKPESTTKIEHTLFVCYSRKNAQDVENFIAEFARIAKQKCPNKTYTFWRDSDILIGENWHQTIQQAIAQADAGLLMVSPGFLNSGYIKDHEVPPLLEKGVLPVGLESVEIEALFTICGLEQRQLYTLSDIVKPTFFKECITMVLQKRFIRGLVESIDQRMTRRNNQAPRERTPSAYRAAKLIDLPYQDASYPYDAYVDISAQETDMRNVGETVSNASEAPSRILDTVLSWVKDTKPVAPLFGILGEFGSGKTFTCKMLAWQLEEKHQQQPHIYPLPVYIDLRLTPVFADHRLPTLEQILAEILRLAEERDIDGQHLVDMARNGEALVIFDGLDEKLTHLDRDAQAHFLRELWRVFPPDYREALSQRNQWRQQAKDRPGQPPLPAEVNALLDNTRCRLVISCRSDFFRNQSEQNAFLQGYLREARSGEDYQGWQLLPLETEQIREYLGKRFGAEKALEIEALLAKIHDLSGLATRPLTLNLIANDIPSLELAYQRGETINAARLYRIMVERLFRRDDGKHQLLPRHKQYLLEDLAAHFWREGLRACPVETLEAWLEEWLYAHPKIRAGAKTGIQELLENDLRNSTLLVRANSDQFRFAHTSIQEYFLACYLLRAIDENRQEGWCLAPPSNETLQFLGELLQLHSGADNLLAILAGWKQHYLRQASEALFHYSLYAAPRQQPQPGLQGFQLHGAQLAGLVLNDVDLSGAAFDRADLSDSRFTQVQLNHVHFQQANLQRVLWRDSALQSADFSQADLSGAVFYHNDFSAARLATPQQHRSQWLHCQLNDVVWPSAISGHPPFNAGCQHPLAKKIARPPARPATPFVGHRDAVSAAAFSHDGLLIASASHDNTLKLWDAQSGQCIHTLKGHDDWVKSVAFDHNSKRIASASFDQTIKIWNAVSAQCILTLKGHEGLVLSVAFNHNSKRIASASFDKTIKIWNAVSGQCIHTLKGHNNTINSVAFDHNSKRIASASYDKTIKIWNAESGQCILTLKGHSDTVLSVAFDHNNKRIASASYDKTIKIWNAVSAQCILTLKGHDHWVQSVAFDHNSKRIASASYDKTIKIWNAESGQCIHTLKGHSDTVLSVAFDHNNKRIASASDDKTIKIWNAVSGQCILTLKGHNNTINSVAFDHNSKRIASASYDKTIKIWNAVSGQCIHTLKGHDDWVQSVAFDHNSKRIASASNDQTIKIWNAVSAQCILTLKGHNNTINSVAFDHNSKRIVSASFDQTIKIWNAVSGQCILTLKGHEGLALSVAFDHNSKRIASASNDQTIKIWNAVSAQCIHTLKGHDNWVQSVAFDHNSKRIASASDDQTIKIWNAVSGQCILTLKGHNNTINSVAFDHNSKRIASASDDQTIKIWNAVSAQCIHTLKGHNNTINSVAFDHNSKRIASASDDQTIKIWNAESGECIYTIEYLPDGQYFTREGHAGKLLALSEDAWQFLGFNAINEHGEMDRYPLETWDSIETLLAGNSSVK